MAFRIESLSNGKWSDDASLLGHGCTEQDNHFAGYLEARAVIDDLVAVGFDRANLRIVGTA